LPEWAIPKGLPYIFSPSLRVTKTKMSIGEQWAQRPDIIV